MPRLKQPGKGSPINNPPTGFPAYMGRQRPRVVTADIWAFIRHVISSELVGSQRKHAFAFLEQASEFFDAARSPRLSCRPVLLYYSFLNLAKVFLTLKHVSMPVAPKHGISVPTVDSRQRLRLEGQYVRFPKCAHNHSQLFPEFVNALGERVKRTRTVKVLSLLRQVPGIHRTFCEVVNEKPTFLPVKRFDLMREGDNFYTRMVLDKADRDVECTLSEIRRRRAFKVTFHQVAAPNNGEIWFETTREMGVGRGVYKAIKNLAARIRNARVWSILTSTGWRYYLCKMKPGEILPPLASVYAVMFYLSSVTRYQPYDFDKIVTGRYAWIVSEFLRTQPIQFLYGLAGQIAGVDVVRPFAAIDE